MLFHHDGALEGTPALRALSELPRVELALLEPAGLLESAGGPLLVDCYADLVAPAARANLLRLALLAQQGGVYLDTDTVTLRSFEALTAAGGAFCGEERLIFPVASGASPLARLRPSALLRMAVRDVLRRLPNGYRAFRAIERFYPKAVNNAVLGAEAKHPLVTELVRRAVALPAARRRVRYALGTHLLQEVVHDFRGQDLRILPPPAFFPLGPEISEHWFRQRAHVDLESVIAPETLLVHWYASVRTKPYVAELDEAFVRSHATVQLFSALALRALDSQS